MGYGSIFNHNEIPNVDYRIDSENMEIRYTVSKNVEEGGELCIYYGKLWFVDENERVPTEEEKERTFDPIDDNDENFLGMIGIGGVSSEDEDGSNKR